MLTRLRDLWEAGDSYTAIATTIGSEFHVKRRLTRNSIAGKIHRLRRDGVDPPKMRGSPIALRTGRPPAKKPVDKPVHKPVHRYVDIPIEPPAPKIVPKVGAYNLADLRSNQCHHVTGDRLAFVYCGAPVVPGQRYCADHCRLMFATPKMR